MQHLTRNDLELPLLLGQPSDTKYGCILTPVLSKLPSDTDTRVWYRGLNAMGPTMNAEEDAGEEEDEEDASGTATPAPAHAAAARTAGPPTADADTAADIAGLVGHYLGQPMTAGENGSESEHPSR